MKRSAIRVLLVDPHALVRAGLRRLIESEDGLAVVGETGSAADMFAAIEVEQPDVVVAELTLEDASTIDILPELRGRHGSRVLIVTGRPDTVLHKHAIRLGARGIVSKAAPPNVLLKAIRKVHAGELWLDRSLTADLVTDLTTIREGSAGDARAGIQSLTPRELEILGLVAQGMKNKAVAARLKISDVTVRHHLTAIFSKLGVNDRITLVLFALHNGLSARADSQSVS